MGIQNVNNAAPKTIADFNADDLKNADEKKFQNTIFDLDQAVRNDVNIDGKLENGEKPKIEQWLSLIDNMFVNVSDNVKEKCEEAIDKALTLIKDLCKEAGINKYDNEQGIVFENDEAQYYTYNDEPTETDAGMDYTTREMRKLSYQELTETAKRLQIPEKKFDNFEHFQKQVKERYNACIDPRGKTNGIIAADLKSFQARYEEELKNIASSVSDDGIYEIRNLYEQLDAQIRFYEELAARDTQKNKQEAMEAMSTIKQPSKELAENIGRAMREVIKNDPMANANKIVNPD